MSIKELFEGVSKEWRDVLFYNKPLLSECLKNADVNKQTLRPRFNMILNCFKATDFSKVKVVLIGQDPYPHSDACGLSFSIPREKPKMPGSLQNIMICLRKSGLIREIPVGAGCGDLTNWAKQGVLLLNRALTTTDESDPHKFWFEYTNGLIKYLSDNAMQLLGHELIFILLGKDAGELEKFIDADTHHIITGVHPSNMAQTRLEEQDKFINWQGFKLVNQVLEKEMQLTPINWNLNEDIKVFTDGSCSGNGKTAEKAHAQYGIYFSHGYITGKYYGRVAPYTLDRATMKCTEEMIAPSNNRGEMLGIIWTLRIIAEHGFIANTTIVTDSGYCKDIMEDGGYLDNWINKNIVEEKKNPDLMWILYDYREKVKKLGKLTIVHVKSHQSLKGIDITSEEYENIVGNEIADQLAHNEVPLNFYELNATKASPSSH